MPRRVALISAAGALALTITACTSSSGGGPTFTPPTSTYQPPTPSTKPDPTPTTTPPVSTGPNVRPGEKPPTFPASLQVNNATAALAFAQYWLETIDWGYATTDSSLARSAFAPSCSDCTRFVKANFDETRDQQLHFRGGRISILGRVARPDDHRNGATAVDDVTIAVQKLETLNRSGHVISTAPAVPRITYRLWLRWNRIGWAVVDWKEAVAK
jgi:hypothetical protein